MFAYVDNGRRRMTRRVDSTVAEMHDIRMAALDHLA